MPAFQGTWPALVTPLTEDGQVDVVATERLIEGLLATGIGGLYVCGGTGEGVLLSAATRREMAEVAIGAVAGQVPVMVHVGCLTTEMAVDLAQHANLAGADAVSAVPPFYFAYPFSAIQEYYRAIASASSLPVYLYYVPGSAGNAMTLEQLLRLCAMEGIAGLKYTSHDLFLFSRLMSARDPEKINVLSGPDELNLPCCALGADGAIGTTYNFMPRLYVDLRAAVLAGDMETARRLQFAANRVIDVLLPYGAIPATKALLGILGFPVGRGVPPMPAIEGDALRNFRKELEEAGMFGLLKRNASRGPEGDPMRGHLG
ncbi:MAG: dihydrodipicolinate synthase family protein [Anaerolineae bacterium]